MGRSYRRTVAVALGTLIASPALAVAVGAVAHADDLSSIGPIDIGAFAETFTYDTTNGAFDNLLQGSYDGLPYYLDAYFDAGSNNGEVLLTIPLLYQGGFTDTDGTITPISTTTAADFLNYDIGLADLGGTPPDSDILSLGPFDIGGYDDTFSLNTATLAFDNFVEGTSNSLPFDLDFFSGAPGTDDAELLLTVPSLFQVGFDDVAGAITPIFSVNAADFLAPDAGLAELATAAVGATDFLGGL